MIATDQTQKNCRWLAASTVLTFLGSFPPLGSLPHPWIFCAFPIILHCSYFCLYSPICLPAPPCSLTATHSVVSALEYVLASYLITDWFQ
ncbi:hypothetical protein C8J57DRAFT_1340516 [Mycena rebaudengoi]|nr:hypothetical protein C8J57DRAFT_1340516 [Mycena rebaudengoi]